MKYVYKFYEYTLDKIQSLADYIVDRVKTMIVLREQDKWMRERAQKLSMRDWHSSYEEESKKIIPEVWDEKGNNDDKN